ncbi:MAG: hypothetical protein JRH20_15025 [Deltaproteobacteria bacterium]|nr:hypothetical protein [Deltaproteobacteria bacterium]
MVSFSTVVNMLVGGPTAVLGWVLLLLSVPLMNLFLARLLNNTPLSGSQWFTLIGPAFLGVGGVLTTMAFSRGLKVLKLLRHGVLTQAKLSSKTATGGEINERRVYELKFRFEVGGQRYAAMARTHEPEKLEDDATEALLYLPQDPSHARLIDHLPGRLKVKELTVDSGDKEALAHLVLPMLFLVALVAFVVRAMVV